MNLNQPPSNYLEDIDKQLAELELETQKMKEFYKFEQSASVPLTQKTIKKLEKKGKRAVDFQPKQTRFDYEKLIDIEPQLQELKITRVKPEISADWVAANKIKPDLMAFYNKEEYETQNCDLKEIQLSSLTAISTQSFDTYMDQFSFI